MRQLIRLLLSISTVCMWGLATSPAHAATSWTITTGGTADNAVQAYAFGPSSITINEGDTVVWQLGSGEPHTVSFGFDPSAPPPTLNSPQAIGQFIGQIESPVGVTPGSVPSYSGSGQLSSGIFGADPNPAKSFSVTFPKAGTYSYLCFFHPPNMRGVVVVQPAGTPYPKTQQEVTATGTQEIQAAIAHGQGALPKVNTISQAKLPDGSTNWTVPAGVGTLDAAILRFGTPVSIAVGDTVTWVDQDPATPHTVTFTPGGKDLSPQDEQIAESALVGGDSYNGTGLVSSGLLGPIPGLQQSYSLKFTTAGTYEYRCLLHDDEGMVATISVGVSAGGGGAVQGQRVDVSDAGFQPATINVKAGQAVTWANTGQRTHTASANVGVGAIGPGRPLDTGGIGPGETATLLFETPGRYSYSSAADCQHGNSTPGFDCANDYAVVVTP